MGLLVLSLGLSAVAPVASAAGQPNNGFCERDCSERFWVLDTDWTVRADLAFAATDTVRVNVSSLRVDVATNAGGGGAMDLELRAHDGTAIASTAFTQATSGGPSLYTGSIDLSTLGLSADWYYLWIAIDDTVRTFEATSAIRVESNAAAHAIETFTDDTFTHSSDVFTTASRIWVRVVGNAGEDPDRWDIYEYVDADSPVNGPINNFDDFNRAGNVYTFSIDLAQFPGALLPWESYTLAVRFTGGAFDAGKQIQIYDPGMTVGWADVAPANAQQGQADVPMLALTLSLPANLRDGFGPAAFNLERIRVARTGAPGTNADVSAVRLWEDVNGDAALDSGDLLLASRVALGGVPFPAWVGQNGVTLTTVESSGPRRLLVTFDIAPTATVGNFAGARINAFADVDMAGHFASIGGLPAQSANVQIVASDVLTVTNDPAIAPATAGQGQTDVPVDLLTVSTNGGSMTVNSLSVDLLGSASRTDVTRVFLKVDDGDRVYEPTVDAALGTPMAFPASGPATFSSLAFVVDATPRFVWIVYDLSPAAQFGVEMGSRIFANASVSVTGGTVYGGNFPLDSGLIRIRGPQLTMVSTDLAPAQAPIGRMNVPMLRLNVTVDTGSSTVLGIRVDKRGTSPVDSDVAAVKLYRDADMDGVWTAADPILASSLFVGGTTVFAPLNLVVTVAQPVSLFVLVDISSAATVGETVGVELQDEAYVAVDVDTSVNPDPFALRSSDVLLIAQVLGTISGTVTDGAGNPLAGATVVLAGTGLAVTTDALGAYVFQDLPLGTYYVVARYPGFAEDNKSAVLSSAAPNKVVNFALTPAPTGLTSGTLLLLVGAIAAILAVLGFLLLMARRRNRCPVCGKPKARDRPVCAECEAKGRGPAARDVPPPPPSP